MSSNKSKRLESKGNFSFNRNKARFIEQEKNIPPEIGPTMVDLLCIMIIVGPISVAMMFPFLYHTIVLCRDDPMEKNWCTARYITFCINSSGNGMLRHGS
jgi:hypothetical protein